MATYQSAYTGALIDAAIQRANNLFNLVYPVGSIYISVNSTSPATLFGGTWELIQNRFLLGGSSTYPYGTTGGEASVTISLSESPLGNFLSGTKNTGTTVNLQNDGNLVIYDSSGTALWHAQTSNHSGTKGYTFTTEGTTGGGGAAHNNIPPYLSVYIWKRTA